MSLKIANFAYGNISAISNAMSVSTINQTEIQNPSQEDLEKLNNILAERLTFDPFSVDDETLWRIVSERENTTVHPYHFMIVRFGEPFEVEAKLHYPAHKRIPVYYTNKKGGKNLKDFSFPILIEEDKKVFNTIHNPHRLWDNTIRLNFRNPEEFLTNKSFFLIRSYFGKNKFGQNKTAWILVELDNDVHSNVRIIREYTLKGQIWAYNAIMKSPKDFGIDLDVNTVNSILLPLKEKNQNLLNSKNDQFLTKWDDKEEYDDRGYDYGYEQDLKDELDYIRQNGGDWIDD